MKERQWSDRRKFILDTLKSLAMLVVAAAFSVGVVSRFQTAQQQSDHEWRSIFSDKVEIRDEFLRASYKYSAVAYDVLRRMATDRDQELELRWQDEYNDDYRIARYKVELLGDYAKELEALDAASEQLFGLYKSYREGASPIDEHGWRAQRKRFNTASEAIIIKLHADIYSGPNNHLQPTARGGG